MQHKVNDPDFGGESAPVIIGDYAWISCRTVLLPGVCVGEGAVVPPVPWSRKTWNLMRLSAVSPLENRRAFAGFALSPQFRDAFLAKEPLPIYLKFGRKHTLAILSMINSSRTSVGRRAAKWLLKCCFAPLLSEYTVVKSENALLIQTLLSGLRLDERSRNRQLS